MVLPNNSIGISDILQYRDCPRRFAFGMRRHLETGEAPEATGPDNAYGTVIHDAIFLVESEELSDEAAVQKALLMSESASFLDPDDHELLLHDLQTYHERDYIGVRTLAAEKDMKVPLMQHNGETIYFRFKLDRLYQHLQNPGLFFHIDYKSSKWRKTEKEVHEDVQLWAYNWGIHELFPECDDLSQTYDQLRYGTVPTHKSEDQRRQIKAWLQREVKRILGDTRLAPKANMWCPWCPIKRDCPKVPEMAEWAQSRIAALTETVSVGTNKDGSPSKRTELVLRPDQFNQLVAELPRLDTVRKTLEKVAEEVKADIKRLPSDKREALGYELRERSATVFDTEAKREMHAEMGDEFYNVVGVTKSALESHFGKTDPRTESAIAKGRKVTGTQYVQPKRG